MAGLAGGTAVVTGGAGGIGQALAAEFVGRGMSVVLADIDEQALHTAAEALTSGEAIVSTVVTDVSDPASVDALAATTLSRHGRVDVVCNNAGIVLNGMTWSVSPDDWQRIIGVNFLGVVNGIRSFVPILREQNSGHVVNTASMAGVTTGPGMSPYAASKHAVIAVSESLYKELLAEGSAVRVSVLCPGMVETSMPGRSLVSANADDDPTAAPAHLGAAVRSVAGGAVSPQAVARQAVAAIDAGTLWVFTHPERVAAISERARDMVQARNPGPGYP